jgi:hypothetical protein
MNGQISRTSVELSRDERILADHLLRIVVDEATSQLEWYPELRPEDRDMLNDVVEAAIDNFILWAKEFFGMLNSNDDVRDVASEAFKRQRQQIFAMLSKSAEVLYHAVPVNYTKAISFDQTLQMMRFTVDVIENNISILTSIGDAPHLIGALLYFSRETAYTVAQVLASSAKDRGASRAHLEEITIQTLLEGTVDRTLQLRMTALGWIDDYSSFCIVGQPADDQRFAVESALDEIRAAVNSDNAECCARVFENLYIVLVKLDSDDDTLIDMQIERICSKISQYFSESPICRSPLYEGLEGASLAVRSAMSGFEARTAAHLTERFFSSSDVLPERALIGDDEALKEMYRNIYLPLISQPRKNRVLDTLIVYLQEGENYRRTAERLKVHDNTVKYRLGHVAELTGWDPVNFRDAYVLKTALKVGSFHTGSWRGRTRGK